MESVKLYKSEYKDLCFWKLFCRFSILLNSKFLFSWKQTAKLVFEKMNNLHKFCTTVIFIGLLYLVIFTAGMELLTTIHFMVKLETIPRYKFCQTICNYKQTFALANNKKMRLIAEFMQLRINFIFWVELTCQTIKLVKKGWERTFFSV